MVKRGKGKNPYMVTIVLSGNPVPWRTPMVLKKGFSYSPHRNEKAKAILEIKDQFKDLPLSGPTLIEFHFFMPIPSSLSKKKKVGLVNKPHTKTPDTSNLIKFSEDCLKGVVIEDDRQVCQIFAKKFYSENPKTVICVYKL